MEVCAEDRSSEFVFPSRPGTTLTETSLRRETQGLDTARTERCPSSPFSDGFSGLIERVHDRKSFAAPSCQAVLSRPRGEDKIWLSLHEPCHGELPGPSQVGFSKTTVRYCS